MTRWTTFAARPHAAGRDCATEGADPWASNLGGSDYSEATCP